MKRFYTLVLGLVAAIVLPVVAQAYSVTLGVDTPANVSVKLTGDGVDSTLTLAAGDNVVEYSDYCSLAIATADGYLLKVDNVNDGYTACQYQTAYNLSLSPYSDGARYNLTTSAEADVRSGSLVLTVDHPEKIAVSRGGTYTNIEGLVAGDNTVRFIPDTENVIMLRSAQYGTPLYSVTLNGVAQNESYGSYNITVAQGDSLKVETDFPDGPASLAISYVQGDNGCVSRITLNGQDIDNTDNVSARLGDKVEVFFNESDYVINSVAINGAAPETSSWGFYSRSVVMTKAENTMVIDATKNAVLTVTLKITDPEHVTVYRGSEWNYDSFQGLVAGDNTLTFSTTNTTMTIVGKNGNLLRSVLAGGEVVPVDQNRATVTVTDGMVVEVESAAPQRNSTMVVYVDNLDGATYGYSVQRSDRSSLELTSGYNKVLFDNADMPMLFAFYTDGTAPAAYVNDSNFEPKYSGGSTFELGSASDNATVVKFYFDGTPTTCAVSFDLTEGVEAQVVRDLVLPVAVDAAAPVQVLSGTRFDMTLAGEDLEVMVNGAVVTPADNVYSFTATADTQVKVNVKNGVENVTDGNAPAQYFNLQGMPVHTPQKGMMYIRKTAASAEKVVY